MSENTQTTQKPISAAYWDKKHKIRGLHESVRVYRSPKRKSFEVIEQIDFVSWLRFNHASISDSCYHVANESDSNAQHRANLNKMGLSKGIPDLMFIGLPLSIEMKRSASGSLSKEQKEKLNISAKAGWFTVVAFGAEAAKLAIEDFIKERDITFL